MSRVVAIGLPRPPHELLHRTVPAVTAATTVAFADG